MVLKISATELPLKIALINLERRVDRLVVMTQRLQKCSLGFYKYTAKDGRTLSSRQLEAINKNSKRPLRAGEIGCFMSHFQLWEYALQNSWEYLWVLEDDVWLDISMIHVQEILVKVNSVSSSWNILHLKNRSSTDEFYQVCSPEHTEPELPHDVPYKDNHLVEDLYVSGPQIGAYSYILSERGLRQCLNDLKTIKNPIDVQMSQALSFWPVYLWCHDGVVFIDDGFSDTR